MLVFALLCTVVRVPIQSILNLYFNMCLRQTKAQAYTQAKQIENMGAGVYTLCIHVYIM